MICIKSMLYLLKWFNILSNALSQMCKCFLSGQGLMTTVCVSITPLVLSGSCNIIQTKI